MNSVNFYKITAIIVLSAICNVINAQEYSGTIKYTIKSNWTKKMQSCEYISQEEKDRSSYVWGEDDGYDSYSILKFTPKAYIFELQENEDYNDYSWRSVEYIIYRNVEENKTYDIIRTLNKLYVIEDSIRYQNWKIKNDMKEIAGHICMNAYYRDTIKDKDIIAWFALDLPVPYGPDRFGGLPGMILELNMNNGAMVYTATSVNLNEEEIIIEKPKSKKKAKIITEAEYTAIIDQFVKESKKTKRPYFYSIDY